MNVSICIQHNVKGGPKKDSKEKRLSDLISNLKVAKFGMAFSPFVLENKNTAIEYTGVVVSNKDTFCKSWCFQFFERIISSCQIWLV